ncbi:MAG TPA: peptidoglycan recognition family protein, partial [Symbiobacteriaceae bacterium]|nr:peptidoglycan recognition family protein [Symbiobacteriaceae bacterium]
MRRSSSARPQLRRILAAIALSGTLIASAAPTGLSPVLAADTATDDSRQAEFAAAAREFGAPESVLLAVSYNLSRWEQHDGLPSTSAGYGLMHLTKLERIDLPAPEEFNTDGLDPHDLHELNGGHTPGIIPADLSDPSLHTLDAAAVLLGLSTDELKRSTAQNIRGAAALLAQYAQETTGGIPTELSDWYGAVAKYSGSTESDVALSFADDVFATINGGVERQTNDGHHLKLAATTVTPNLSTATPLALKNSQHTGTADCPNGIACRFIPAFYGRVGNSYGNYDTANRVNGGATMPSVDYIVIHDTEGGYQPSIDWFRNPASGVSAHYVIRSADGEVTQMVDIKDTPWHAGNWFFNTHSIGIEHEGYAIDGAAWYNEHLYRSSAALVRYLSETYNIPADRAHIIGHDEVPGTSTSTQRTQHWDPGPFWDWGHFMELVGAPITPAAGKKSETIVTIKPSFQQNAQPVNGAELQPSNFVYLYQAPSFSAPLADEQWLPGVGTQNGSDWGDKARVGQSFAVAERQGDWTAIWYGGKKVWFSDPNQKNTLPGTGILITPKAGKSSIPVYGTAYAEASAYPPGIPVRANNKLYDLPSGQVYVAAEKLKGRFYRAVVYSVDPSVHKYIVGNEEWYRIQFNHRWAFVKAADVDVV